MKRCPYSHKVSVQDFSVEIFVRLMGVILSVCNNTLIRPDFEHVFGDLRKHFSPQVTEFIHKLSPLVINKRLDKKALLGAKITFYYEDEE